MDDYDIENLKILNSPNEILVINIGQNNFNKFQVDCNLEKSIGIDGAVNKVIELLHKENIIPLEYYL
jgi:bifunctional enzyme CysN/CysC